MIDTSLFPYENHPYRLEFGEKKNRTICFFSCQEHLDKYLERYRLDKRTIKIDYRDAYVTLDVYRTDFVNQLIVDIDNNHDILIKQSKVYQTDKVQVEKIKKELELEESGKDEND